MANPRAGADVEVALSRLKNRNKTGAGRITQGDVARALGVHQNTVARWERRDMIPDDQGTVSAIVSLANRVNDWHLHCLPLLVTECEPCTSAASSIIESVAFLPSSRSGVAKVEIRLSEDADSLTMMIVGPDRGKTSISHKPKGPFYSTISFPSNNGGSKSKPSGLLTVYIKFD